MNAKNVTFTTARPRLVSRLMDNGFQPMSVGENPWNPGYRIWTFARTPELNALVDAFYAELEAVNEAVNPGQNGGSADA